MSISAQRLRRKVYLCFIAEITKVHALVYLPTPKYHYTFPTVGTTRRCLRFNDARNSLVRDNVVGTQVRTTRSSPWETLPRYTRTITSRVSEKTIAHETYLIYLETTSAYPRDVPSEGSKSRRDIRSDRDINGALFQKSATFG